MSANVRANHSGGGTGAFDACTDAVIVDMAAIPREQELHSCCCGDGDVVCVIRGDGWYDLVPQEAVGKRLRLGSRGENGNADELGASGFRENFVAACASAWTTWEV